MLNVGAVQPLPRLKGAGGRFIWIGIGIGIVIEGFNFDPDPDPDKGGRLEP